MKRCETIIKQIADLEKELYTNYDYETIRKVMGKMLDNHEVETNGCDLVWVIYSGVDDYVNNEEE